MIYGNNDGHVYKATRWNLLGSRHEIRCSLCPPHRKENDTTHRKRKARRSWKFNTRNNHQYNG